MYLIDTNIFILYFTKPLKLPENIVKCIDDSDDGLWVSAAVPWEISIKHASGKLREGGALLPGYYRTLAKNRLKELVITGEQAVRAGQLPPIHRDPFDRMIIAQAQLESLTILTLDSVFDAYNVSVMNK